MKKYTWTPIFECDDDDDNPTTWAAEINSERHGRFCWITEVDDNEFEITTNTYIEIPVMTCKSLASAKRWVAINIK